MLASAAALRTAHVGYLERARALTRRAEALGGVLVSWSATTLAFAWDLDSIDEAITLSVSLDDETSPPAYHWACGVAEGMLEPLAPEGRATLAWGEPLLRAITLARIADAGQVLVDEDLGAVQRGELATRGSRVGSDAGLEIRGLELALDDPWQRSFVSERAPLGHARVEDSDPILGLQDAEPEEFATKMVELTRQALLSGNAKSLQRLSEGLRATGEHDALAERMRAIARLSAGQFGEALRALRKSRALAESEPPSVRCQASLALAFALANAGRPDDALLEALDAVARAREANDRKSQAACIAFLAKLYGSIGHQEGAARLGSALASYGRFSSPDLAAYRPR
jgi:tetratricopeptide (TPR) repeat protein